MPIRLAWGFATILLASACGSSEPSIDYTGGMCGISQTAWHLGESSPPNRVLVWRVSAGPASLLVNGERLDDDSALAYISRTKALRPSPYLILSHDRSVSCSRIRNVAERISQSFNCQTNYCFYQNGSDGNNALNSSR
jgi:hypothetical protein